MTSMEYLMFAIYRQLLDSWWYGTNMKLEWHTVFHFIAGANQCNISSNILKLLLDEMLDDFNECVFFYMIFVFLHTSCWECLIRFNMVGWNIGLVYHIWAYYFFLTASKDALNENFMSSAQTMWKITTSRCLTSFQQTTVANIVKKHQNEFGEKNRVRHKPQNNKKTCYGSSAKRDEIRQKKQTNRKTKNCLENREPNVFFFIKTDINYERRGNSLCKQYENFLFVIYLLSCRKKGKQEKIKKKIECFNLRIQLAFLARTNHMSHIHRVYAICDLYAPPTG